MSTEAEGIQRIISASVRDLLDAYRLQAAVGPVTDKALEELLFRASHGVLLSLVPYPREQRVALLPSVVAPFHKRVPSEAEAQAVALHEVD